MAEIRVEHLHKAFGDFVAVGNSSFTVADGSFFVLLGPSGCGKTTTLRMIAGLELPTSGLIRLAGEDVTFKRAGQRDIAFVFQLFALYPHMNVRDNIAYPLRSEGRPRAEVRARVEEAAKILRIDHLIDRPVSGLSGGDRQRVALGRAIVRKPAAFLMDEPLGALDTELREAMIEELHALHVRLNATTVYVTHDQMEAMAMADTIAVMNHGVIEQCATPRDIYDHPASLFVAEFIGAPPMNVLAFQGALRPGACSLALAGAEIAVPEIREAAPEGPLALGVRPEHVRFADTGALRGRILGSEYLGTTQIVTVATDLGTVKARLPSSEPAPRGASVGLAFRTDKLSLFHRSGGAAVRTARDPRPTAGAPIHG